MKLNEIIGKRIKYIRTEKGISQEELAEAAWFSREEIQAENEDYSLTNEMIVKFKEGRI